MVDVSLLFRHLSMAPGRQIQSKIQIGDDPEAYIDNSVISDFELTEMIFPNDELAFGTTCAARLNFKCKTDRVFDLQVPVYPFIRFITPGDESEWLPLGTFWMSSRWGKRGIQSITCYDKMYRSDAKYNSQISYPATHQEILEEIAGILGVEIDFVCQPFMVQLRPIGYTCRDMLGFIASAHAGCARINRAGKLNIKTFNDVGFTITKDNYITQDLKQDPNTIRQIDIVVRDGLIITRGDGGVISTYPFVNPLANDQIADYVWNQAGGLQWRGCRLGLPALPFLEVGDIVFVQNYDDPNQHDPIIIGEQTFTYSGAFSGDIVSKTRNPGDEFTRTSDLARELEAISQRLRLNISRFTNEDIITITTDYHPIIALAFTVLDDSLVKLDGIATILPDSDCEIDFFYQIIGRDIDLLPIVSASAGKYLQMPFLMSETDLDPNTEQEIQIFARVSAGSATINRRQLLIHLTGMSLNDTPYVPDPRIRLRQQAGPFAITLPIGILDITEFALAFDPESMLILDLAADVPLIAARLPVDIGNVVDNFYPSPVIPQDVSLLSDTEIQIKFANPIFEDAQAITDSIEAITILAETAAGPYNPTVMSITQPEPSVLVISCDSLEASVGEISLTYDSALGYLYEEYTGNYVQSFGVVLRRS